MSAAVSVFDDPMNLPGKVLDQPWGGAVLLRALGYRGKGIESRKNRITYRGELVLTCGHARNDAWMSRVHAELVRTGLVPERAFDYVMSLAGKAVVVARVAACRPLTADDYAETLWWDAEENARKPRWAWVLADLVPLRPFPVRGVQGFVRVPRDQVDAARMTLSDPIADFHARYGAPPRVAPVPQETR